MNKSKLNGIALFMAVLIIMLPVCVADELQLTYDANGNLLSGDGYTRTYNSLNQLTRIENSTGSLLETFVYHPTEERIYKKIVYDSAGAVKETITYFTADFVRISNSSGTFDSTYVMHEGQKVAELKSDGSKLFMHDDHLGSTGAITDGSGLVVEQTTYSPFGEIVSGGELSRFDYEGKEFDSVVGDYDFHFRKYCVKFGIFCQPDTLIQNVYDPQSLNRYMFERGNPYGRIDPTGHIAPLVAVGIGAGIGAAIGLATYFVTHRESGYTARGILSYGLGCLAAGAVGTAILLTAGTGFVSGAISGSVASGISQVSMNIGDRNQLSDNLAESLILGGITGGLFDEVLPSARTWLIKNPASFFTTKTGRLFIKNRGIEESANFIVNLINQQADNTKETSESSRRSSTDRRHVFGGGGNSKALSSLAKMSSKAGAGQTAGDVIRRWRASRS